MKEQWLKIYQDLYYKGKLLSPRGLKIKELEDYQFFGNPYNRFANFKERNFNIKYIVGEFCWYLNGDLNDVERITYYSKFWNKLVNKEYPLLNSNYGYYIFKQNQFNYCLNKLKEDKDTRQATIIIAYKDNILSNDKDKICTYSMNFRIRENKLNMTVNMRSNDFILGLQIDYFQFSVIQEMLLCYLKEMYSDLEMGYYCHKADSLHIYENKFEINKKIIDNNGVNFELIQFPKIKDSNECNYIINNLPNIEYHIRNNIYKESLEKLLLNNNYLFTLECIKYLKNDKNNKSNN